MRKIFMVSLVVFAVTAGIFLGVHTKASTAASAPAFAQVMPFTTRGVAGIF